jgi:NAD(P)H dehydrogenase (quinone)
VRLSDLYAMGFDPVAKAADFARRRDPDYLSYALEQRHNEAAGGLAPDIRAELDRLLWCDFLLLVFPLFWFSPPAILKGWIDRVLVSGVTYGGRRFYDRGGLKGRRAMIAITLGGREHMFGPDAIHGPLEDMLRPLLRGTLAYVALDVLPSFVAWHVPYVDDAVRRSYLDAFDSHLRRIDELVPLRFPCLDDFDATMRPKS